jgi:hypothetical protein
MQKSQKAEMKGSIDEFEAKLNACREKGTEGETKDEKDTPPPPPVVPAKRAKQLRTSRLQV